LEVDDQIPLSCIILYKRLIFFTHYLQSIDRNWETTGIHHPCMALARELVLPL
jgi:hypothetical protein